MMKKLKFLRNKRKKYFQKNERDFCPRTGFFVRGTIENRDIEDNYSSFGRKQAKLPTSSILEIQGFRGCGDPGFHDNGDENQIIQNPK